MIDDNLDFGLKVGEISEGESWDAEKRKTNVVMKVRKENELENKYLSLKELGYGEEIIIAKEVINDKFCEKGDYTCLLYTSPSPRD